MKKLGYALAVALVLTGCKRDDNTNPVPAATPAPPGVTAPAPAPLPEPPPAPEAPPEDIKPAPAASPATPRAKPAARTGKPPVLRAVRSARQAGADRVTVEFDAAALPQWHAEFVDRPVHDCGSGDQVAVAGTAWLQVRFTGAQAHNDQGASTSGARRRALDGSNARELVRTCDFEGEVTWVIGVTRKTGYKALTLGTPSRLVIDIAH